MESMKVFFVAHLGRSFIRPRRDKMYDGFTDICPPKYSALNVLWLYKLILDQLEWP